jgi:hypothetical protein
MNSRKPMTATQPLTTKESNSRTHQKRPFSNLFNENINDGRDLMLEF